MIGNFVQMMFARKKSLKIPKG